MAKLRLNPEPTFKAKVGIPVPGAAPAPVLFTFKHRTRDEAAAWLQLHENSESSAVVQDCVVGWDLEDEFTPENVDRLCNNFPGAGVAIFNAYIDELRGIRVKN